jgi:orotate phosphoribosyltransferase
MESVEKIIARQLLDIKAVMLNVEKPFTWASGWKSPIYCDNRKILSYPKARSIVTKSLARLISQSYENVDVIAGVATGAIAWGVLVAEELGKPFIYVRPKPKDHGTGAQIEGELPARAKVVVVEDLISTGGSSLSAVECLNKAGADVLGMVAIFSYNFNKARRAFEYGNVELRTLTNYDSLINEAVECKYIKDSDLETLQDWRYQPEVWGQQTQ